MDNSNSYNLPIILFAPIWKVASKQNKAKCVRLSRVYNLWAMKSWENNKNEHPHTHTHTLSSAIQMVFFSNPILIIMLPQGSVDCVLTQSVYMRDSHKLYHVHRSNETNDVCFHTFFVIFARTNRLTLSLVCSHCTHLIGFVYDNLL